MGTEQSSGFYKRILSKLDFKMVKVAFYCIALMAIGCQQALATDSSDYNNLPGESQPQLTPGVVEVPEGEYGEIRVGVAGRCGNKNCPKRCCSKIEKGKPIKSWCC